MKHNKGIGVIGIILIIVGVLVVGGGIYLGTRQSGLEPKLEDNWEGMQENLKEENKDSYPKVFEYGDKENQLLLQETIEGYATPNIFSINKDGNVLFRDYNGIRIFSSQDGLKYSFDSLFPFRYAYMDDKENIYILNDFQSDIPIITKYDKNGQVLESFNGEELRLLFDHRISSNPLFDQLYVVNDNLYLYSQGSEDSYKVGTTQDVDSRKVSGKYGTSGDLFYTRVDNKSGYDYLKVIQSNGKEKEFSFKNEKTAGFFFLNEDKEGNAYVQSDSCSGSSFGQAGENYCFSRVYKINKSTGDIIGSKELPRAEYVSYDDLLVDEDGNIFYLNLQKDKAYLEKYIIE